MRVRTIVSRNRRRRGHAHASTSSLARNFTIPSTHTDTDENTRLPSQVTPAGFQPAGARPGRLLSSATFRAFRPCQRFDLLARPLPRAWRGVEVDERRGRGAVVCRRRRRRVRGWRHVGEAARVGGRVARRGRGRRRGGGGRPLRWRRARVPGFLRSCGLEEGGVEVHWGRRLVQLRKTTREGADEEPRRAGERRTRKSVAVTTVATRTWNFHTSSSSCATSTCCRKAAASRCCSNGSGGGGAAATPAPPLAPSCRAFFGAISAAPSTDAEAAPSASSTSGTKPYGLWCGRC